jgi:hypothetical protein
MTKIVPSAIAGGSLTGSEYGSPELIARALMYVFPLRASGCAAPYDCGP